MAAATAGAIDPGMFLQMMQDPAMQRMLGEAATKAMKSKADAEAKADALLKDSDEDDDDDDDDDASEQSAPGTPTRKSAITGIPHTPVTDTTFLAWKKHVDELLENSQTTSRIMKSEEEKKQIVEIMSLSKLAFTERTKDLPKDGAGGEVRVPSRRATDGLTLFYSQRSKLYRWRKGFVLHEEKLYKKVPKGKFSGATTLNIGEGADDDLVDNLTVLPFYDV